jgi:translation elongation factor EF-1beta
MSKRGPISTALALLFGAVLAAGCRPSQTVERQTKDAALEAQVKAKIASDVGAATVTAVEVNVTNGVATLAGPVRSDDEKQRAESAARSVEGITGVNNNLQVSAVEPSGMAMTPSAGGSPTSLTPIMAMPPPAGGSAGGSATKLTPVMAMPPPTGTVVPMAATPPPATTPY